MTATATYNAAPAQTGDRLRRLIKLFAPFDVVMGVVCIAAADPVGGWVDVDTADVVVTGGVFLFAGIVGLLTLRSARPDGRWVAGANVLYAAWSAVLAATALFVTVMVLWSIVTEAVDRLTP